LGILSQDIPLFLLFFAFWRKFAPKEKETLPSIKKEKEKATPTITT
jgi:hypothetical protein